LNGNKDQEGKRGGGNLLRRRRGKTREKKTRRDTNGYALWADASKRKVWETGGTTYLICEGMRVEWK